MSSTEKILAAYQLGCEAKRNGKPSNAPPKLTIDEKKAWRNGYNDTPAPNK